MRTRNHLHVYKLYIVGTSLTQPTNESSGGTSHYRIHRAALAPALASATPAYQRLEEMNGSCRARIRMAITAAVPLARPPSPLSCVCVRAADRLAELRGGGGGSNPFSSVGSASDVEAGGAGSTSAFMQAFFDEVQEIKKTMSSIRCVCANGPRKRPAHLCRARRRPRTASGPRTGADVGMRLAITRPG